MSRIYLGRHRGPLQLTQKILPGDGEGQTMNDSFIRIGKQLQAARKERGLRTADVARELRISADYLRWLESGDFDQLPAPTYVSGFLRSYGKYLGLNGADLAGRFYAIKGDASSAVDYKLPLTAGPPQRSAPAVASLFVVLALIGYAGWYWVSGPTTPDATAESELAVVEIDTKQPGLMEKNAIGQRLKTAQSITGAVPGDQDAEVTIAKDDLAEKIAPVITLEADISTSEGVDHTNAADSAAGTAMSASVLSDGNEVLMNGSVDEAVTPDIARVTPSLSSVIDGDVEIQPVTKMARRENIDDAVLTPNPVQKLLPGSAAAVATSRDPYHEVTIRATASSWVEIVRDDGTAVFKKLMKEGESYVVDDGSTLYLSTGNAGGIELVTAGNEIVTIGTIGEIVRDLPLAKNRLRERF